MSKRNILKKTLNLVVAVAAVSAILAVGVTGAAASDTRDAERAYKEARQALNNDEYKQAAGQFAEIYQQYTETKYASRALYWQAYSLYKIGATSTAIPAHGKTRRNSTTVSSASSPARATRRRRRSSPRTPTAISTWMSIPTPISKRNSLRCTRWST